MPSLRSLKGVLHLLFLTVFVTYSSLYALSYVNNFQPTAFSAPKPSPYVILPYSKGNVGNTVKMTESDNSLRVNKEKLTSGKERFIQNEVEASASPAIENLSRKSGTVDAFGEIDDESSKLKGVNEAQAMIDRKTVDSDELMENIHNENNDEERKYGFYDDYVDLDILAKKLFKDGSSGGKETNTEQPAQAWPIVLEPSNASALQDIDLRKYSEKERIFLEARSRIMSERARLVGRVCREQPLYLHKPSGANHLVWDKGHEPSIVWCPNYKVASTTMMMSFLRVSPEKKKLQKKSKRVKQSDVRHIYWTPKTAREKAKTLRESVRVIMVRHPFTRILSAYRDKMTKLNPGPKKFQFRKLQKEIIAKYRHGSNSSPASESPFPTFPEFVSYVIDETRGLASSEDWKKKVRCWVAYWAHCNVCATDYTVIMKLETMEEDRKFLVSLSNMEELKEKSREDWLHLRNATSKDLAPQYYSQLTRDQILNLYNNYKLDFDLFDYSIDDYLALV